MKTTLLRQGVFYIAWSYFPFFLFNGSYLNSKPEHWRPQHKVVVKEIEDANKIRMALHVTHTINFQNYGEKSSRRSKLVLQLKQKFEDLGIGKYHVLPETQVGSAGSAASPVPQPAN